MFAAEEDGEVAEAFTHPPQITASQVRAAGTSTTPQYTIVDMDHSDDEESDHASDMYPHHSRGRVSPSPYTANTDRARQFNAYVRGVIEQKLDVLIPISHQPRELISEIIADASTRFPEFSSCVRKRIRTFLKSFRRSKKVKEHHPGLNGVGTSPHHSKDHSPPLSPPPSLSNMADVMGVSFPLPSQCSHTGDQVSGCGQLPTRSSLDPQSRATVVGAPSKTPGRLSSSPPAIDLNDLSELPHKRLKLDPSDVLGSRPHPPSTSTSLSGSEVSAVRQLITGYRESAAFLQRAADQLEAMLASKESSL